jgi:putative isomerase
MLQSLLLLLPLAALCDVQLSIWPTSAFAPPSLVKSSTPAAINGTVCTDPSAYCSARFSGTVSSAYTELVTFSITTDGGVNLWVDDHLLIDAGQEVQAGLRTLTAPIRLPMSAGVALPVRLDYLHYPGPPSLVQLSYVGNSTPPGLVPAEHLTPTIAPHEQQRAALKERMLNPPVQWQTFDNPTMGAHVRMPTGFAMDATLGDTASGALLGRVIVFRRSNPAITYVGPHSYNGSDYTELRLDAWGGRDCTVVFSTTVVQGGEDLYFLAASNGTDCSHMALVLQPKMLWSRAGELSAPTPTSFLAACPGFSNTSVYVAGGVAPVPFAAAGPLAWALPLGGGPVGYSTGSSAPAPLPDMLAAIAAAQVRQAAAAASWGAQLEPVYLPMASCIAWNTMYTPLEGVVTPVSRGWDFGEGYVLFDWDNYFLAYMASCEAASKDIAYSNLLQTTLMRTVSGFVPNFASGLHASFDRTEPQLGALVALRIFSKWGDAWVVEAIIDALYSWNCWVWERRRGEGSLAGSDGRADLIVLGSDPNSPATINGGSNNLQSARYESGLDNSPMYDGSDRCGEGGPVCFDPNVTHHMSLYDVGMTALYVSDTQALIALATAIGRTDLLPLLTQRLARITAAMNAHLWMEQAGAYSNVLYNGSFYPRLSPTSLFPMISGSASLEQASALAVLAASPAGLCLNLSYTPHPSAAVLVDWYRTTGGSSSDNAGCVSDACLRDVVNAQYGYIRVEAVVLGVEAGAGAGLVPLGLWHSAARKDYALTNSTTAPPDAEGGYELVRQEGWCYSSPPTPTTQFPWPATELTLWYSAKRGDYQTCGSASCLVDTAQGYSRMGSLCYAFNGTGPEHMPCKYGGNSIVRSDEAFFDNVYWRGRIWGPHLQLLYWALQHPKYQGLPEVVAARQALVAQGKRLVQQEWDLFRQVTENYNGVIGVGEDVGDADPFYRQCGRSAGAGGRKCTCLHSHTTHLSLSLTHTHTHPCFAPQTGERCLAF